MAALALPELRDAVWRANLALAEAGLVTLSFGNASGLDPASGVLLIKPSGVPYAELRPEQLVAVAIENGLVLEGDLRPSSDTPTHIALYRRYPEIRGVVHTHSTAAASWAQACRSIPPLGTTHADHFRGPVPVTRQLREEEVAGDYELATGEVIVETLERLGLSASDMPAALVASHGPFTWGPSARAAVDNAIALEAVAAMASQTFALAPGAADIRGYLLERHFRRKHGPAAYYGQAGRDPGTDPDRDTGRDLGRDSRRGAS
jgi:L-ribulose-5-phosphate 4-epimerase